MLMDFSKERYDIVIQAGQSNAQGSGFGAVDEPYQPNDNVWEMDRNFTISIARELVDGNIIRGHFGLSFADEYIKNGCLADGRKLLILRTSVGGTGFLDCRWGENDDLFLRMAEMIETALSLNEDNRLVCLLWHQGETDAILHSSFETHYANLMRFVRLVREKFDVPALSFIAGEFVRQWIAENTEICEPVLKAIRAVCAECGNAAFVETEGLASNKQDCLQTAVESNDTIHFSRKSLSLLGKRYFEAYREILR